MRSFMTALQFLTKLPVRFEPERALDNRDVASSYYFYPVIGFLIGIAGVLLRRSLNVLFPLSFSVVLMLGFFMWITGGLHEDGLADVADGMAGGWTREQRLSIMKDSRIGAFGAMALAFALLSKYTALISMNPERLDAAVVSAQVLSRWAFLPFGYFNPYAREGLGSEFIKHIRAGPLVVGTAFSTVVVILLSRVAGVIALSTATATVVLASAYFRRRLGGITGDCFGATFQFVEILTYAAFLT